MQPITQTFTIIIIIDFNVEILKSITNNNLLYFHIIYSQHKINTILHHSAALNIKVDKLMARR